MPRWDKPPSPILQSWYYVRKFSLTRPNMTTKSDGILKLIPLEFTGLHTQVWAALGFTRGWGYGCLLHVYACVCVCVCVGVGVGVWVCVWVSLWAANGSVKNLWS